MQPHALLGIDEMYRADAAAVAAGVASIELMENAGQAIADAIEARWRPRPASVLCGPGNNGGDGFVVARLLASRGWPVRIGLLGDRDSLKGDAKINADRWQGPVEAIAELPFDDGHLVVDALFGAGLARPIEGAAAGVIEAVNARKMACVAADVPSGVHGDTGAVMCAAFRADLTVTFFRGKPGHHLLPGRALRGELVVADIGIPDGVLEEIRPGAVVNHPDTWLPRFPWPREDGHKYNRGHAVIAGGAEMTGAARLAALSARRIGAGLVTIAAPAAAFDVYAAGDPGNLVTAIENGGFGALMADPRKNAVLVGPGGGLGEETRSRVSAALSADKAVVVDADALTAFADDPDALFELLNENAVLTPHDGEFRRLFDHQGDKLTRARRAAEQCGASVLLKGADTVVAAPDGRAAINPAGTPFLATAGSGDVLAGIIAGLMAQGMDGFDAAAAAAWVHGRAAEIMGPGLIAEDLPDLLPDTLAELHDGAN
ncbi:MAG: NAD(P)H-hydrate dehydratase [Magnetovibrio sp.]|nr:NAD(P)H-hydrate dehydratase [Magnetovibrio sp.]